MRQTITITESELKSIIKDAINESSLNRVLSWMNQYDIACLTAFRGEYKNATPNTKDDRPQDLVGSDMPYKYTTKEKVARNRELKASLLSLGYGVTNIRGNYIENYGTIDAVELGESSFFVVNLKDDPNFKQNIFELSEYYNQDCFLFKPKGSDEAYNIGTNYGEYPGYGNADSIGKLHINIDNEFLSRVGNASFAFTSDDNPKQDNREYGFKTRKQDRANAIREMLELDVYENYSRGSRMSIKGLHQKTKRHIMEMKSK